MDNSQIQQFVDAEEKYREAIELNPDDADAYNELGLALEGQGKERYADAIDAYKEADALFAKSNPDKRKHPLFNWGKVLCMQQQFSDAEVKFRQVVAFDPDDGNGHNWLGFSLHSQGKERYPEAIEAYQKADALFAQSNPVERKYPLIKWADLLRLQEQFSDAELKYLKVIEIEPEDADAYLGLGIALEEQGKDRYPDAIEAYKKSDLLFAKSNPVNRKYPLRKWGDLLRLQLQFTDAELKFREVIKIAPEDANAYNSLGLVLEGLGEQRYPAAIEAYKEADVLYAKSAPDDRKYPLRNWAKVLRLQQKYADAELKYKEAIGIDPEDASSYNSLGITLEGLGKQRYPDAIEAYKKADTLFANSAPTDRKYPLGNWGNLLRLQRQFVAAEAKYREAINIDPDNADARNGLGYTLTDQGQERYVDAIEEYKKADALFAKSNPANRKYPLISWGWILNQLENYDEAIAKQRLAIEMDDNDAESYYSLGNTLADASQYEEAIAAYNRAIRRDADLPFPKHNKAHYLFHLGRYVDGWKAWKETKEAYSKLLDENLIRQLDIEPAVYFASVLDEIYNERQEAEKWYLLVLELEPNYPEALIGLATLYQRWLNSTSPSPAVQCRFASVISRATKALKARLSTNNGWHNAFSLANFYLDIEDTENAMEWLLFARESCGELRYRRRMVAISLGTLYGQQKQFDKAAKEFQDALLILPEDLKTRSNLAAAYLKLEQLDPAENEYRKVLTMAPGQIESLIGLAQLCIELGDTGEFDRYAEAEQYLSSAIEHGLHKFSGSKRLVDKELAQVYYLRGYVRVKYYEGSFGKPLVLFYAMNDFTKCAAQAKNGELSFKAASALKKIQEYTRESRRDAIFEWVGPLMICLLATFVFVVAQLDFFFDMNGLLGLDISATKNLDKPTYLAVTFGSLLFIVAGLYLPKVLKIKVGTIELEKSTVAQISAPTNLGISR